MFLRSDETANIGWLPFPRSQKNRLAQRASDIIGDGEGSLINILHAADQPYAGSAQVLWLDLS